MCNNLTRFTKRFRNFKTSFLSVFCFQEENPPNESSLIIDEILGCPDLSPRPLECQNLAPATSVFSRPAVIILCFFCPEAITSHRNHFACLAWLATIKMPFPSKESGYWKSALQPASQLIISKDNCPIDKLDTHGDSLLQIGNFQMTCWNKSGRKNSLCMHSALTDDSTCLPVL